MRQAAGRVGGISRSPLQWAVTTAMERWRKKGMQGYNAPQKGKELDIPLPEEGSKQRGEVERAFTPPPPLL